MVLSQYHSPEFLLPSSPFEGLFQNHFERNSCPWVPGQLSAGTGLFDRDSLGTVGIWTGKSEGRPATWHASSVSGEGPPLFPLTFS